MKPNSNFDRDAGTELVSSSKKSIKNKNNEGGMKSQNGYNEVNGMEEKDKNKQSYLKHRKFFKSRREKCNDQSTENVLQSFSKVIRMLSKPSPSRDESLASKPPLKTYCSTRITTKKPVVIKDLRIPDITPATEVNLESSKLNCMIFEDFNESNNTFFDKPWKIDIKVSEASFDTDIRKVDRTPNNNIKFIKPEKKLKGKYQTSRIQQNASEIPDTNSLNRRKQKKKNKMIKIDTNHKLYKSENLHEKSVHNHRSLRLRRQRSLPTTSFSELVILLNENDVQGYEKVNQSQSQLNNMDLEENSAELKHELNSNLIISVPQDNVMKHEKPQRNDTILNTPPCNNNIVVKRKRGRPRKNAANSSVSHDVSILEQTIDLNDLELNKDLHYGNEFDECKLQYRNSFPQDKIAKGSKSKKVSLINDSDSNDSDIDFVPHNNSRNFYKNKDDMTQRRKLRSHAARNTFKHCKNMKDFKSPVIIDECDSNNSNTDIESFKHCKNMKDFKSSVIIDESDSNNSNTDIESHNENVRRTNRNIDDMAHKLPRYAGVPMYNGKETKKKHKRHRNIARIITIDNAEIIGSHEINIINGKASFQKELDNSERENTNTSQNDQNIQSSKLQSDKLQRVKVFDESNLGNNEIKYEAYKNLSNVNETDVKQTAHFKCLEVPDINIIKEKEDAMHNSEYQNNNSQTNKNITEDSKSSTKIQEIMVTDDLDDNKNNVNQTINPPQHNTKRNYLKKNIKDTSTLQNTVFSDFSEIIKFSGKKLINENLKTTETLDTFKDRNQCRQDIISVPNMFPCFDLKNMEAEVQEDLDSTLSVQDYTLSNKNKEIQNLKISQRKTSLPLEKKEYLPNEKDSVITNSKNLTDNARQSTPGTNNFKLGSIVWAQIGKYPYWPCIITNVKGKHEYKKNINSTLHYHVVFFGDYKESWIKENKLLPFFTCDDLEHIKNSKKGVAKNQLNFYTVKYHHLTKWQNSVSEADQLKEKSLKNRLHFVDIMVEKYLNLKKNSNKITVKKKEDTSDNSNKKRMNPDFSYNLSSREKKIKFEEPSAEVSIEKVATEIEVEKANVKIEETNAEAATDLKNTKNILIKPKKDSQHLMETRSKIVKEIEENTTIADIKIEITNHENEEGIKGKAETLVEKETENKPKNTPVHKISATEMFEECTIESQKILFRKNNIFKGVSKEKACHYCALSSNVLKCKGGCNGFYHEECGKNVLLNLSVENPIRCLTDNQNEEKPKIKQKSFKEKTKMPKNIKSEKKETNPSDHVEANTPIHNNSFSEQIPEVFEKEIKTEHQPFDDSDSKQNNFESENKETSLSEDVQIITVPFKINNDSVNVKDEIKIEQDSFDDHYGKQNNCADETEDFNITIKTKQESFDDSNNRQETPHDRVQIVTIPSKICIRPSNNFPKGFENLSLSDKIDYKMKEMMKEIESEITYEYIDSDSDTSTTPEVLNVQSTNVVMSIEESVKIRRERKETFINVRKKLAKKCSPVVPHVTAETEVDLISDYQSVNDSSTNSTCIDSSCKDTSNNFIFKCGFCATSTTPPCFVCHNINSKIESSLRQKCSLHTCGRYYHPECLKDWPQTSTSYLKSEQKLDTFTCPSHICHTCFSIAPSNSSSRCASDKIVKCLRCPASYHSTNFCVPAGSMILSTSQIICPRHGKAKKPSNTSWCFLCNKGGNLYCCEFCPISVHADCMPLTLTDDGKFICDECQYGALPLYDQVVWVKLGSYRWWPALILFPQDIPTNILNKTHDIGDFVVKFFGTYNYVWVNRSRTFEFQEGDGGKANGNKKLDLTFLTAVKEAAQCYKIKNEFKRLEEAKSWNTLKPPPYFKIRVNRPVGNVRHMDFNLSNVTPCNCDPNEINPCGPDTNCLNRLLLTECDPDVCPAGDMCKNQSFEKREYPPLVPYKTEKRGWGLKTLTPIKKGQFIIEYVGEVIDYVEYQRRLQKMHELKEENYYFLTIDKDRMIDAGPKGNVARFMNHCCQPNCETQKWTVKGDTRVGLFATVDIPADTELTFNYNLECVGEEKKECRCGATNCSGYIGAKAKSQTESDAKKRKKIYKKKKAEPKKEILLPPCFVCGKNDNVGLCNNKTCSRAFHLKCLNMTTWPEGNKFICPWHNCNICSKRTTRCCIICLNSYCPSHSEGNVRFDKTLGFLCNVHDNAETSSQNNVKNYKDQKRSKISSESIANSSEFDSDDEISLSKLYKKRPSTSVDSIFHSTPIKSNEKMNLAKNGINSSINFGQCSSVENVKSSKKNKI